LTDTHYAGKRYIVPTSSGQRASIMTNIPLSRLVVPSVAIVAACALALLFALQHVRLEPSDDTKAGAAATASRLASKPASDTPDRGPAALEAAQAKADAVVAALAGPPVPQDSGDGAPAFDVARIEPTGETVIAGRAAPGATVELLRDGQLHDRAVADQSGQFTMVPPRLPPGTYGLTLRSTQPDGKQMTSKQGVAVTLAPSPNDRPPAMAMMTPGKPISAPSQAAPEPTSGAAVVEAIGVDPSGKFHMTGRAAPGSIVKLYLNDSFVASVTAGADARFAITINDGVTPGSYRVRLDEMAANSGAVRGRVEMPFNVPDRVVTGSTATTPPGQSDVGAPKQPQVAAAVPTDLPDRSAPSAVVVPKIATATVSRGDSLWRLSRISYGVGMRYAAIYNANRKQIRNPNLIYPGQTFVVPTR
jgi:nucleoid-associated protein YgaU